MQLRNLIAAMAVAALVAGGAQADTRSAAADSQRAAPPVYIVTARNTYTYLADIARNPMAERDSIGSDLVVAEVDDKQIAEVGARIHKRELRCGGFFAFGSRAEAEAFVRNDAAAISTDRRLLLAYTIDNQATVNPWLTQPTEPNIRNVITQLSSYKNRYYASTYGKSSAEWIRSQWAGLANGRSDVTTELYTGCTNCATQPSVILTIRGNDLVNEVVVLGAHLDSINSSGSGSNEQTAPGADDDASGIATLTEVIRVSLASGWKPRRTIKFMGYAAEEVGLRGSNAIAQAFKAANTNVVGVLQLDMTNYKSGNVEDMQLITDYSNTDLKNFVVALFDTYLAPRGLTRDTYTCGYGCSDHASWTSAGYPSAMMFEAGNSSGYFPSIHSVNDTLANMGNSAQHSVKFAQLGLAFAGELGKTTGTPPPNTPPVANFAFVTNGLVASFTDSSTDSDGTIASRSWNFGDSTTSTATNPSKTYAAAGTYTVTLTVTDNGGASNTKTSSVTVTAPPTDTVLQNGVAKTGLAAATGVNLSYTMVVPAGATGLKFVTSGGTGDADLYVKFGSAPTTTTYDCKSDGSTNAETCNIATAQAGTYHVLVRAYAAFSGLSLTGSYTTGGGGGSALQNGVPRTGLSGALNATQTFTLAVPAGATNLKFVLSGGTGDADLYVKFGSAPTLSSYDCRPF
ncbi:MAG: M20/M25/M40 family metallo-hydrolase, partial [Rhodanobacteraceae bacterium]|nr:M20/M25/M40 family metallo-hydrolase [Rhodanobacteraceae bacterium]